MRDEVVVYNLRESVLTMHNESFWVCQKKEEHEGDWDF